MRECLYNVLSMQKSISRKNPVLHFEKYPSSGRLWEVKHKGKFQTFSSKSGRSRLREMAAYKRFQI